MAGLYDETLANFNLDFLHSSTSNAKITSRHDKQRQSILNLKKKVVASSDLLKKYYNQKERLEEIECLLLASKEECREACIEKSATLERNLELEKYLLDVKTTNQQLLKDVADLQVRVEAMNSHAYQLQTLVKEKDTMLLAMKVEKEVENNGIRVSEIELASYKKAHEAFLKDILYLTKVIIGKKQAKDIKQILQKYRNMKILDDDVDSDIGDIQDFDDDMSSSIGSPIDRIFCMSLKKETLFKSKNNKEIFNATGSYKSIKDKLNDDLDCGNEVVSEDTGRGSSLALFNINSPDNDFTDSIAKDTIVRVDVGTSPMRVEEDNSSNIFDEVDLFNDPPKNGCHTDEYSVLEIPFSSEIVVIKEKRQLVDVCTSPIQQIHDVVDKGTNTIQQIRDFVDKGTNPILQIRDAVDRGTNPILQIRDCVDRGSNPIQQVRVAVDKGPIPKSPILQIRDVVSKGTSTILQMHDIVDNDTSTILQICDDVDKGTSPILQMHDVDKDTSTILQIPDVLDKEISPTLQINDVVHNDATAIQQHMHDDIEKGTSLINFVKSDEIKNVNSNTTTILSTKQPSSDTLKNVNDVENCPLNSLSSDCELETAKKAIGDDKNREENENCNDEEVQMILDRMKLHYKLLSPIPKRPKVQTETVNKSHVICPEALKIREENISLKTNVDFLCKEIMHIKNVLANKDYTENVKHSIKDMFGNEIQTSLLENNSDTKIGANLPSNEKYNKCEDINASIDIKSAKSHIDSITLSTGVCSRDSKISLIFGDSDEDNNTPIESIEPDHTRLPNNDISRNTKLSFVSRPKRRQLTKLDRIKRIVMPKSKIQPQIPMRKIRKCLIRPSMSKNLHKKPLDILNNKAAYDKALNVMVDLKSKKKPEPKITRNIRKISDKSLFNVPKSDLVTKKLSSISFEKDESPSDKNSKRINIHQSLNPVASSTGIDRIMPKTDMLDSGNLAHDKVTPEELGYNKECNESTEKTSKTARRFVITDSDSSLVSCKRILRSSALKKNEYQEMPENIESRSRVMDYNDLDMFDTPTKTTENENINSSPNLSERSENYDGDSGMNLSNRKAKKRLRTSLNNSDRPLKCVRSSNSNGKIGNLGRSDSGEDLNVMLHEDENRCDKSGQASTDRLGGLDDRSNEAHSLLCKMIEKYGRTVIKTSAKKISENIQDTICQKIDTIKSDIIEKPIDQVERILDDLIQYLNGLKPKQFISGLMKYLQRPARIHELSSNKMNKQISMTKKEQIIVYIIKQMNKQWGVLQQVLSNIEFALFCLSKDTEFYKIEVLSHFYAVLCRVFNLKHRLKVFMLDAMYCLHFKCVVVLKQCLTTWPHVLPLAHLPHAQTPIVSCIVYLLHFLKCDSRGTKRILDIRLLLEKKYLYNFADWNQNRILELFSNAVKSVKDDPNERDMLRIAIIILAKRQGVKWCQTHIVNNLLLPIIEDQNTTERVKIFCIKVLGPLYKVYPSKMKVHCEIITNRLHEMLEMDNLSHGLKEAVFTSLIYMSKHNPRRVTTALLQWNPEKVSADFEDIIKAYVQEKTIKTWKFILTSVK